MPSGRAKVVAARQIAPLDYTLPISKLRGVPERARLALKVHRITTCEQLLANAGSVEGRVALARVARLEREFLDDLVRRADMARVSGVGVVFGAMLHELGVRDVSDLTASDPAELHERLRQHNQINRMARRSPTPEEVVDWVRQAQSLPVLVTWRPECAVAVGQ
jgi:nucleotidyltransferase/DNA polymerase involved in DNA repair